MIHLSTDLARRHVVLSLLASGLAACEAAPSGQDGQAVAFAPGASLVLPPPSELGRAVDVAQLIEARQGSERIAAFEARLSVDAQRLLLVGTDMLGRRALTAAWDGRTLRAETADWLPQRLRVRNVVADIVLLFWPQESLQRALAPSGATVRDGDRQRSIGIGAREVVRIGYDPARAQAWNGRARFENLAWGYELDIRSNEVAR